LDLALDGSEISVHIHQPCGTQKIHQPCGTQKMVWVDAQTLQSAIGQMADASQGQLVTVPARLPRSDTNLGFLRRNATQFEVRTNWWIWVDQEDLKAALTAVGILVPW
jgi:hypothetical protein